MLSSSTYKAYRQYDAMDCGPTCLRMVASIMAGSDGSGNIYCNTNGNQWLCRGGTLTQYQPRAFFNDFGAVSD